MAERLQAVVGYTRQALGKPLRRRSAPRRVEVVASSTVQNIHGNLRYLLNQNDIRSPRCHMFIATVSFHLRVDAAAARGEPDPSCGGRGGDPGLREPALGER